MKCPEQVLTERVRQEEEEAGGFTSLLHILLAGLRSFLLHPANQTIYSRTIIINKAVYNIQPWPCIS